MTLLAMKAVKVLIKSMVELHNGTELGKRHYVPQLGLVNHIQGDEGYIDEYITDEGKNLVTSTVSSQWQFVSLDQSVRQKIVDRLQKSLDMFLPMLNKSPEEIEDLAFDELQNGMNTKVEKAEKMLPSP
ncbi:hypothetical protein HK097_002600 [Rhizophlyctis rosea]|uniref:Uncharacterized protein n=1 Tax=Rhizophlyctis rosea TaxID=64517 RepID=A0AAD5SIQ9_9FUNG|nr:hypothetical protein HK097_002600 [Rhizophlyctis rosea]